jgi:translation machinery-associated protein 16
VHKDEEALKAAKSARRPGRPPSVAQERLERQFAALEKEYREGFRESSDSTHKPIQVADQYIVLPDLSTSESVALLQKWEGPWSYLSNLTWKRISSSGPVKPANFPPKGDH